VVGRQPYVPVTFTPGEIPGTHFQGLSRPQGTWNFTNTLTIILKSNLKFYSYFPPPYRFVDAYSLSRRTHRETPPTRLNHYIPPKCW